MSSQGDVLTALKGLEERLDGRFRGIEDRLTGVEGRIEDLRREMYGHFDAIYKRFDRLETEYLEARLSGPGPS